jgi:hypothetical protein
MDTRMRWVFVVVFAAVLLAAVASFLFIGRRQGGQPSAAPPATNRPDVEDLTPVNPPPSSPNPPTASLTPSRATRTATGPYLGDAQLLDVLRDHLSSPTVRNNAANRLLNERDPRLAGELVPVELRVPSPPPEKILVPSLFHDLPLIQHYDMVGIPDSR